MICRDDSNISTDMYLDSTTGPSKIQCFAVSTETPYTRVHFSPLRSGLLLLEHKSDGINALHITGIRSLLNFRLEFVHVGVSCFSCPFVVALRWYGVELQDFLSSLPVVNHKIVKSAPLFSQPCF